MSKAENPNQDQKIIIQEASGFEYQGKKYHFENGAELQFDSRELRDIDLLEKKRIVNLQKLFTPKGMDLMIAEIQKEVADFSADISTKEGRAKIISMAAKVAKCKSPIKNLASELKEESRRLIDGVNAQWNRYEKAMDELRDEIRKPVDEIEEREAAQLKALQDRLAEMERIKNFTSAYPKHQDRIDCYKYYTETLQQLFAFEWGDFQFKAQTLFNQAKEALDLKISDAIKANEQEIELAQLKKEKEEREQKDREEQIRKDAEEKARKDEEDARKKAEEDKRIAEERLVISERKNFLIGLGFVQDAMTGDFIFKGSKSFAKVVSSSFLVKNIEAWQETVENAKKLVDAILKENDEFAKAEEKRIADEAIEKERKRQEDEKEAERLATEKREKNKRHRAKINNEAVEPIRKIAADFEGSPVNIAQEIIKAIAKGEVPHVQINY